MSESEKEKQEKCHHIWVYDLKTKVTSYPPLIRGVCKCCGKQTVVTREAYDKLLNK